MIPTTFMHIELGKGMATLAIHIEPKEDGHVVTVATAFCSPKDRFTKSKGRFIASGRLSAGSAFNFNLTVDQGNFVKDTVYTHFIHKLEGKWFVDPMNSARFAKVPSWAKRAAKYLVTDSCDK